VTGNGGGNIICTGISCGAAGNDCGEENEGVVILRPQFVNQMRACDTCSNVLFFFGYVGLNNGNGRGSMDSLWTTNEFQLFPSTG